MTTARFSKRTRVLFATAALLTAFPLAARAGDGEGFDDMHPPKPPKKAPAPPPPVAPAPVIAPAEPLDPNAPTPPPAPAPAPAPAPVPEPEPEPIWDIGVFGYVRAGYENVSRDPNYDFVGRNSGFILDAARIGVEARSPRYHVSAVDDWFNLLNVGQRYVGVGTGDSHDAHDEPGQFRTMVYVGDDRPGTLTDERVVEALKSRRVVATNGPMLDFFVDDPVRGVMGQTIDTANDKVSLSYTLSSAPWVGVGRINIYANGTLAQSLVIDEHRNRSNTPMHEVIELELARDASNTPIDTWYVMEAIGYTSMFPVIRPLEVPPVVLTDAVASLAGPLGIASDDFGALRPPQVFPVTAYAITNPVWVTRGKHAFQAPGVVPPRIQDLPENDPQFQAGIFARGTVSSTAYSVRVPTKSAGAPPFGGQRNAVPAAVNGAHLFDPRPENPFDVRKALTRFGHLNGHGK